MKKNSKDMGLEGEEEETLDEAIDEFELDE